MEHLNLVANELASTGFETVIKNSKVEVSLDRHLGLSEVREALTDKFEGIQFNLQRLYANTVTVV